MQLSFDEIIEWLKTEDPERLKKLWQMADETRRQHVGDEVHLRGLIEISNICCRQCAYCGISALNARVERYRMSTEDVMECVNKAVGFGYGTVVLQSGEDYGITKDWIGEIIQRIRQDTQLAVTLSLGELTFDELKAWKESGAHRYLLRFETSDENLYRLIHPALTNEMSTNGESLRNRIAILHELKELGYEVGSGVMVGIPGQSYATLARDILLFTTLDLDMIGVGPYLPHPHTPLGQLPLQSQLHAMVGKEQVPNTELMTYKTIALIRLVCPDANIPSTTALATVNKGFGRELGLMRGANVVMPNVSQLKYRDKYAIYPNKVCVAEEAEACDQCMQLRISSIGRHIGKGSGSRRK